jgi:hypothetical protein
MPRVKNARKLLRGTWRSDRARTVAQWVYPKRLAVERRKWFESIFGHLVVQFTAAFEICEHKAKRSRRRYRVVWSSEGPVFPQLFVVTKDAEGEKGQHIFFDSPDSFYAQGGKCAEFFKRVPSISSTKSSRS